MDTTKHTVFGDGKSVMAVGDLKSNAIGSGARANGGKPPFELIPLNVIAHYHRRCIELKAVVTEPGWLDMTRALACLGDWQESGDIDMLYQALWYLGDGWEECAWVFDYGREKYDEWNWAKGMKWSIPLACAARHLRRMLAGEANDSESGRPHRGHVFCNIVMLITYHHTYLEGDDRPRLLRARKPDAVPEALAA